MMSTEDGKSSVVPSFFRKTTSHRDSPSPEPEGGRSTPTHLEEHTTSASPNRLVPPQQNFSSSPFSEGRERQASSKALGPVAAFFHPEGDNHHHQRASSVNPSKRKRDEMKMSSSASSTSTSTSISQKKPGLFQNSVTSTQPPTSREGILKKKGLWTKWKEIYVVVKRGMLLEFSSKRSQKPQKILDLSLYSLRLADELCGSPYSFCLYLNQKDFQYYAAETKGDLASWVSCCHFYCKEDFNLLWKPDDVLEAINDAVVVCSDNGVIIGVNNSSLELFGYTREEMMGKSISILMPERIRERHESYVALRSPGMIGIRRIIQLIHKDKHEFDVTISLGEMTSESKFVATIRKIEEGKTESQVSAEIYRSAIDQVVERELQETSRRLQKSLLQEFQTVTERRVSELEEEIASLSAQIKKQEKKRKRLKQRAKKALPSPVKKEEREGPDIRKINFKNYKLNERLAPEGGSGASVYVCTVDGWQCVVKALNLRGLAPALVHKFESEVSLLESLPSHRNLVRYLYHERTKTTFQLFMTRYDATLNHFLSKRGEREGEEGRGGGEEMMEIGEEVFGEGGREGREGGERGEREGGGRKGKGGPLELKTCLLIGMDIVMGLSVLHLSEIVHRDLKTDNIFVTMGEEGDLQCCSIGDMDVAKKLSDGARARTCIGTPGYMAPEIFGQNADYSYPCDIWSFGVIMYEVISAGRKDAPSFLSPKEIEKIARNGQFPYTIDDPSFGPLIKLTAKCLRKIPKRRPNAESLKRDFLFLGSEAM